MDWIQGNKFQEMATFTYCPTNRHCDDYYGFPNTLDINKLKDNDTIFTHPFYVNGLLDIIRHISPKIIIITHNGDNRIDSDGVVSLDGGGNVIKVEPYSLPDNLITWYAQNVNTINPRIESIPIGIENNRWQPHEKKREKMIMKMGTAKNNRNLLYMNHTIRTNPKEREQPYVLFEGQPWVTSERGSNGARFDEYLDNLYNHKFVICPEGNGMDTHRTWECLYMGTFPVEKRNLNNRFYCDLPICFVNEWDEINEQFLNDWYNKNNFTTDTNTKLTFKYWKDKINNVNM